MRSWPAWPADASTWTETGTATARPRSGRASRPAARASPSSPRQPRSASAALSPPDPQPPAVPVPCSHRKNPPTVEPAAARSDIRAAATPSLSVSNPGQPAPQRPITENYRALGRDEPGGEPHVVQIHIVADNYATHKTPAVQQWLDKHPRFHVHFTPTSSSWLNQVERWFGLLTERLLRRGVHKSVRQLERDILAWVDTWNEDPRPSSGRNPQKKSSNHSGDFCGGSKIQDTRWAQSLGHVIRRERRAP